VRLDGLAAGVSLEARVPLAQRWRRRRTVVRSGNADAEGQRLESDGWSAARDLYSAYLREVRFRDANGLVDLRVGHAFVPQECAPLLETRALHLWVVNELHRILDLVLSECRGATRATRATRAARAACAVRDAPWRDHAWRRIAIRLLRLRLLRSTHTFSSSFLTEGGSGGGACARD
jgi:hypothetical protein